MKQVFVIHGGTTYTRYEDYIADLNNKTVYIDRLVYKSKWKELLQQNLGDDYQVLLPSMPNPTNANYNEWKIWFDRIAEIATDDCILVGHSLGAIFLAKYLSENTFPRTIKATILIAAAYDDESIEDLTDFKIQGISELFSKKAGKVVFFFGSDDPVIPFTEYEKYKQALPDAKYVIMSAPDHFVRSDFSELTNEIIELSA